jgi:antitoxin component of RelBE/YafQ-DinJ toxin-antitoxin module
MGLVTIEIQVDEAVLKEAQYVLHSIGMDVQIATNVLLRRVAIERGFPMSMTNPVPSQRTEVSLQEDFADENMYQTRSNSAITQEMVDEVWQAFLRYHKGLCEISRLRDEVAERSGMNSGSAFIYLNILANLIKGEPNTRTLKMKDLEYFMSKIKSELQPDEYRNAIHSLKDSIPYWRKKLAGNFAERVEKNLNSKWKE